MHIKKIIFLKPRKHFAFDFLCPKNVICFPSLELSPKTRTNNCLFIIASCNFIEQTKLEANRASLLAYLKDSYKVAFFEVVPHDLCKLLFSTNQKGTKHESANKIFFGSAFRRELCPLLAKRTKCIVLERKKNLKVINIPCIKLLCIYLSASYVVNPTTGSPMTTLLRLHLG
jgi:hypothetical protein